MAITKNIVDMMGGTIEVQTEQGKGTEFIIRLSLRIQPEHHRIEKIAELEGLKALVVDDDFNTCDSVTKMLVKVGMRSEWTLSGREAVLRARQSVEMANAFEEDRKKALECGMDGFLSKPIVIDELISVLQDNLHE